MAMLKRYKILITTFVILGIFFYLYTALLINKTLDYMITELLKHSQRGQYVFDVSGGGYNEAIPCKSIYTTK